MSGDSFNRITLLGRLTEEPRFFEGADDSKARCVLIVATGEDGNTVFHEVKVFGLRAGDCARLVSGRRVHVDGFVAVYQGRYEVIGKNVIFL